MRAETVGRLWRPRWRVEPISERASATLVGTLRRVLELLGIEWGRFFQAVFLGSLSLGSAVGLSATAAWLIARASQMPPVLELSLAVVAVRAFGISRGVFRYLERLVSHDVGLRGMTTLREVLYVRLANGRPEAVAALKRGDLLARVGADVDAVGDLVVRGMLPAAVASSVALGSIVLVGVLHPGAGFLLSLGLVLAGGVAPWLSAEAARMQERQTAAARAEMTAVSLELLEGAGPLRVSGQAPSRLRTLRAQDQALAEATDAGAHTAGIAAALGLVGQGVAVVAALWLGLPAVSAGALAPVWLPVIALVPLAAFEALVPLPAAAVQLHRSGQAARRILELLDQAGGVAEDGPERSPSAPMRPTGVSLQAHHLRVGWPGRAAALEVGALQLSPGRTVALVGPSGSGKSTLLMTLSGLLPPRSGHLELRDRVGPVQRGLPDVAFFAAEDAHVFETTIFENLRVVRGELTREEAGAALNWAGLETWLAGLPEGLDTRLGPDGASISGGERRRLLLARVRLSSAPLLLVDEPAEHLDPEAADALLLSLLELAREEGRGVVVATHRLSALERVDEVLLLGREGREGSSQVVARGSHRALCASVPSYRWALDQERTATRA